MVELATDNLAALPADWVNESFGQIRAGLDLRSRLAREEPRRAREIRRGGPVRSRVDPARRADAACVQHRHGPLDRGHVPSHQGRLGAGALPDRARDHGAPDGERRPHAALGGRLRGLGPGAARRGERGAEPAPRRRAARGGPRGAGHRRHQRRRATTRSVAPVCCSAGSTRPGAWATARSNPLRVSPATQPMRCTCSATSRPIPTGSMPSAARPTTARRWRSPSRAACDRSSRHCHLGLGRLYRRLDRREQAHEHLTTAATPCTATWTCRSG